MPPAPTFLLDCAGVPNYGRLDHVTERSLARASTPFRVKPSPSALARTALPVLSDNDLSRTTRHHVAASGAHLEYPAFRDAQALGFRVDDLIKGICHPSSHVLPIAVPEVAHGRAGVVACPYLSPTLRMVLWLRDDPADPPLWVAITGVFQ